jgi:hypothetical protein
VRQRQLRVVENSPQLGARPPARPRGYFWQRRAGLPPGIGGKGQDAEDVCAVGLVG